MSHFSTVIRPCPVISLATGTYLEIDRDFQDFARLKIDVPFGGQETRRLNLDRMLS